MLIVAPTAAAADPVASAWTRGAPSAVVGTLALGGDGALLDAVATVAPDAATVPAGERDVLVRLGGAAPRRTAWVEAGRAVPIRAGAPRGAVTSAPVGEALAAAADLVGPGGRVVLATGGAGSHDGGAGLLAALAGTEAPRTPEVAAAWLGGGTAVGRVEPDDVVRVLGAARRRVASVDLVAAVEDDLPLLGLDGASARLDARPAPGAGAGPGPGEVPGAGSRAAAGGPGEGVALERALGHLAAAVEAVPAARPDLLAGPAGAGSVPASAAARRSRRDRLSARPGAGAGGGLGLAVAALGGRLLDETVVVADALGLDARVARADLVVVVLDVLDGDALHHGPLPVVAAAAAPHALPVVVLAGTSQAGRREWSAAGVSGVHETGAAPGGRDDAVARVARTWDLGRA